MIRINLFKKDNIDMNLLIGTLNEEKFNMPMYNTDITIWKGVDNTIEFSIRNHDRKSVKLEEGTLLNFVAINQQMKQQITKPLEVISEPLGRYKVTLTNEELNDLDCGTFVGHVSVINDDNEELLYTGTDWYPYFNVEIKPNRLTLIDEPLELDSTNFNKDMYQDNVDGKVYEVFTSSVIKSDITPYHSYLIQVKDFLGTIKIQGSNEDNPEHNENDWFDITQTSYLEEPYTDGPILLSGEGKFLWTRVQYKREDGQPSEIINVQYRN